MLPMTVQFFIAMIACAINERQQKARQGSSDLDPVLREDSAEPKCEQF